MTNNPKTSTQKGKLMSPDCNPVEQDQVTPCTDQPQDKLRWEAPIVTSFKPVTETRGISFNIGDGISNLS